MVAVSAGSRLSELQSLSDLYDPRVLLVGEGGPSLRAPPAPSAAGAAPWPRQQAVVCQGRSTSHWHRTCLPAGGMVGLASLVPVYLKHRARGARVLPQRARSGE
jgi:hypothetical protein